LSVRAHPRSTGVDAAHPAIRRSQRTGVAAELTHDRRYIAPWLSSKTIE
jgi:hypothetical protein